jgi:hypothetical protein
MMRNVAVIFGTAGVSQVLDAVITAVAVQVGHVERGRARAYECLGNQ